MPREKDLDEPSNSCPGKIRDNNGNEQNLKIIINISEIFEEVLHSQNKNRKLEKGKIREQEKVQRD